MSDAHATGPARPPSGRVRSFLLGSGPLKRGSDRLHACSRLLLVLALLLAVPVGAGVGSVLDQRLREDVAAQRAAITRVPATLVADAPGPRDGADLPAPTAATWPTSTGPHRGAVLAPAGFRAGAVVRIWIDAHGEPTSAPMTGRDIRAEAVTSGILAAMAVALVAVLGHLGVVALLDRRRLRRWEAEWERVAPQWTGQVG